MKFSLKNDIAYIGIDDGKVNAADLQFVDDMSALFDRACAEAKAVVLYGRPGMFSAGFDLKKVKQDPAMAETLGPRGMALLTKIYAHPQPVVVACDGHAIGLGAFLLLAADVRVGSAAEYNITLPETALGMGFPPVLMILIKHRVTSNHRTAAVLQSKPYGAEEAVVAGFLDEVIERDSLMDKCQSIAERLSLLPSEAYAMNKENLRSYPLKLMRECIARMEAEPEPGVRADPG